MIRLDSIGGGLPDSDAFAFHQPTHSLAAAVTPFLLHLSIFLRLRVQEFLKWASHRIATAGVFFCF